MPNYAILLDVGLRPEKNALYKMYQYMKDKRITFPALKYDLGRTYTVGQYFDNYLPCISIVTPEGKLIEKSLSLDKMAQYF